MAGRLCAARSSPRSFDVPPVVLMLFVKALLTALLLTLPAVALVAVVGVVVGLLQTVFQVQDSNVSFFPKLVAVACLAASAGLPALALLRDLIIVAIRSLPHLAAG